jgi:hypothetical protein
VEAVPECPPVEPVGGVGWRHRPPLGTADVVHLRGARRRRRRGAEEDDAAGGGKDDGDEGYAVRHAVQVDSRARSRQAAELDRSKEVLKC